MTDSELAGYFRKVLAQGEAILSLLRSNANTISDMDRRLRRLEQEKVKK